MLEYYNQSVQSVGGYPTMIAVIANLILGVIFLLSFYLPKKFVDKELRRVRKNPMNKFDKVIVLVTGMVFSIVLCVVGAELISGCVPHQIPDEFVSILVMFAALSVLLRSLVDSNLIDKKEVPSHLKLYRISFCSFLIASSFSILSTKFSNTISYGFTVAILAYYFVEMYVERKTIDGCFTLLSTEEFSVGIKLVDFISRKFIFIAFLSMLVVPLVNHKNQVPLDIVLYINIRDMFCVLVGMFMLQVVSSSVVNHFVKKLDDFEKEKLSKKSTKVRKTNWIWICDVLVVAYYSVVAITILWLVGINVQKYIFHDNIVSSIVVIFGSVLLYNAFDEFMNSIVDKSAPDSHEKVLTFLPIIKIIFNVSLIAVVLFIVLSQMGIEIMPILLSLGTVWVAFGLAAQDIIKSFLQGIVFLFENNFYIGDCVVINGKCGNVIKISIRTLTLRDVNGDEYIIPYSNIGEITNQSRDYYLHIESLLVAPDTDVNKACELMTKVVKELKSDPAYGKKIFSDINFGGVKALSDKGIEICWSLKVHTDLRLFHFEIYKRLIPLLRKAGITVPYKQEYKELVLSDTSK